MKKIKKKVDAVDNCCNSNSSNSCAGAVYGLGFIGAAIYYIQAATGFWAGVLGILKSLFWPAFLIHKLLGM